MGFLKWLLPSKSPAPSLKAGRGWTFDVHGEASYQSNIAKIVGGKKPEGHSHKCQALLVLDNKNRSDSNAVRVDIGGKTVGYLSREHAVEYREKISSQQATCGAKIVGGWNYGKGDEGHFGVKLNLRWPPTFE